ncbi:MAG: hypothetical protein O3C05_02280 [Proteobacteria bacterium]|nr:hypothetical protein [Pseudomonadota bacterium]
MDNTAFTFLGTQSSRNLHCEFKSNKFSLFIDVKTYTSTASKIYKILLSTGQVLELTGSYIGDVIDQLNKNGSTPIMIAKLSYYHPYAHSTLYCKYIKANQIDIN